MKKKVYISPMMYVHHCRIENGFFGSGDPNRGDGGGLPYRPEGPDKPEGPGLPDWHQPHF